MDLPRLRFLRDVKLLTTCPQQLESIVPHELSSVKKKNSQPTRPEFKGFGWLQRNKRGPLLIVVKR